MKYDFDTIIPRRGRTPLQNGHLLRRNGAHVGGGCGFRTATTIVEACKGGLHTAFSVMHQSTQETYYDGVVRWFENRHRWRIDPRWIVSIKAVSRTGSVDH